MIKSVSLFAIKNIFPHRFPDHRSRRFRRNRGCIPDWQCKASCSNRCRPSSKDDKDSAWSDTSCRHSADAVRVSDTACYSGPSDKQSWRAPVQLHYCQVRIRHSAVVVPLCTAVFHIIQHIQCFLIVTAAYKVGSSTQM